MKVTKKAINKALPSIRYFNRNYVTLGFTGILPENAHTLASVVFRVNGENVVARDYAIGEAYEREDYYMEGCCVEASSIIAEWMDGALSREEVVDEIQEKFKKLEVEE